MPLEVLSCFELINQGNIFSVFQRYNVLFSDASKIYFHFFSLLIDYSVLTKDFS